QGAEAGGHVHGTTALSVLVPTPRLAAALVLGAQAVSRARRRSSPATGRHGSRLRRLRTPSTRQSCSRATGRRRIACCVTRSSLSAGHGHAGFRGDLDLAPLWTGQSVE